MNSGDNSGVQLRSDPRLWDSAILGSLTFSLHFPGVLPYSTPWRGVAPACMAPIDFSGVGVDFHPQEEEL